MTNSKVISAINTDWQRTTYQLIAYGQVADPFEVPPAPAGGGRITRRRSGCLRAARPSAPPAQRPGFKAGAALQGL